MKLRSLLALALAAAIQPAVAKAHEALAKPAPPPLAEPAPPPLAEPAPPPLADPAPPPLADPAPPPLAEPHEPTPSYTPSFSPTSSYASLPASCTYRPTATMFYMTGCDLSCDWSIPCIVDDPVILPCGCKRAAVDPVTTTICPTKTPCYQCTTGWGIATINATGCATSSLPTTPTPTPTPSP